jgi:hypothetical protein
MPEALALIWPFSDMVIGILAVSGNDHRLESAAARARLRASTSASHSSMPRYLTERTGQSERVSFETASALELPFDDGRSPG